MKNSDLLRRLDRQLEKHAPVVFSRLQPPADRALIERVEQELGFELPEDMREIYRWHNGCRKAVSVGELGLFGRFQWHELQHVLEAWRAEADAGFEPDEPYDFDDSEGQWEGLRARPWRFVPPQWVPIGRISGDPVVLLVDTLPGPVGTVGQLVIDNALSHTRGIFSVGVIDYFEELVAGLERDELRPAALRGSVQVTWCRTDGEPFASKSAIRLY